MCYYIYFPVENYNIIKKIFLLNWTFNMFAITCHICVTQWFVSRVRRHIYVTLLITYICVQIDYQLFVHHLLIIHIISWLSIYILYIYIHICIYKYIYIYTHTYIYKWIYGTYYIKERHVEKERYRVFLDRGSEHVKLLKINCLYI